MDMPATSVIKQHLIDPEICIRCNTCEAICPVQAITHDSRNYVVDARQVQPVHGVHLAVPDRLDRQLAHHAARAWPTAWRRSSAGTSCPAELTRRTAGRAGVAAGRRAGRGAAGSAGAGRRGQRRSRLQQPRFGATMPPWSAAHAVHQPLRPEGGRKDRHGHRGRQRARHRGRPGVRHPPHRARLRRDAVSRCSKASRSRIVPPGVDAGGPAASCPAVLDRQPAQRRAARLQQRVADHQARARRPPGQPGARRRQQLHVRPAGRRQGAGDRPVRRELPDAEPPAQPHRDDLHRHRHRRRCAP